MHAWIYIVPIVKSEDLVPVAEGEDEFFPECAQRGLLVRGEGWGRVV